MLPDLVLPAELAQRFELRRHLGAGAMGAVYHVYDRRRRVDLALKTLRSSHASGLRRFKREFRSLSGLVHDNLVTLYELHTSDDLWFFTMQLVHGGDLLEFLRPYRHLLARDRESGLARGSTQARASASADPDSLHTMTAFVEPSSLTGAPTLALSPTRRAIRDATLRLEHLRPAFTQLIRGLAALHDAGKLHLDVKPSNVLVQEDGQLLLCDFGLVAELQDSGGADRTVSGTPRYMAPEQAAGESLTPASDFYAAGVILYELLTGHSPFEGDATEMMRAKRRREAPAPQAIAPEIDPDLAALCHAMLLRDPRLRPSATNILEALQGRRSSHVKLPLPAPTAAGPAFIGRHEHRRVLLEQLERARSGEPTAAFVCGRSGMGKSVLCEEFLRTSVTERDALVLHGRCYERAVVPYKALDALVDELTGHLLQLPREVRSKLLPPDVDIVARLFPVFEEVLDGEVSAPLEGDRRDLRQRAFAALLELLRRLSAERLVILHLDDLQWGDLDSASFFTGLFHADGPMALLLLASYRSEERDSSPLLQALLMPDAPNSIAAAGPELEVAGLQPDEARELVLAVVGAEHGFSAATIDALLAEADGHPFFLAELAQARAQHGAASTARTLDEMLAARIAALPHEARALLTTCAVAGRPMAISLVSQAANIKNEPAALSLLQAERFLRSSVIDEVEVVEPYHDRVRETSASLIAGDELRHLHRRIARALEWGQDSEPHALVEHWIGAGDRRKACHYAQLCAQNAEKALAFAQAAHYYGVALELTAADSESIRVLMVRRAHALANAGCLREAATTYLEAAEDAELELGQELRVRAAEQLIRFGDIKEGTQLAVSVLEKVGIAFPKSRLRVIAGVLWQRARLKRRGFAWEPTSTAAIDPMVLRRIDACQAVAGGLSFALPVYGAYFHAQEMLWALDAGDPYRVGVAMNFEIGFRSLVGKKARAEVATIVTETRALAEQLGSAGLAGWALGGGGVSHYLAGEFPPAYADCRDAAVLLRQDDQTHFQWQAPIVECYSYAAAIYLGKFRELSRVVPARLRDALAANDQYSARSLRAWRTNIVWLAMGQPDEALQQALAGAPQNDGEFTLQHFYELTTRAQIELYTGDTQAAWERVATAWRRIRRTLHLRIQTVRVQTHYVVASAALARAGQLESGGERRRLLATARKHCRALAKEDAPWAWAKSTMLAGLIALAEGNRDAACEQLAAAEQAFARESMFLLEQLARLRRGQLIGGDEGSELIATAHAWMASEAIAEPERMAAVFAPVP